eukprot:26529-Eustigmatos_ZCMA.PRE.1
MASSSSSRALAVEQEVAKLVVSYTGTRRLRLYKLALEESRSVMDFYRLENAMGQVYVQRIGYNEPWFTQRVHHKPLLMKSLSAIEAWCQSLEDLE